MAVDETIGWRARHGVSRHRGWSFAVVAVALVLVCACAPSSLPQQGERTLPDHAVGEASYVFTPCQQGCPQFLAMSDGTRYRLPVKSGGGMLFTITLSPDGRWLGWSEGVEFRLRDLTGTQVRRVIGRSEVFGALWSRDARWLLLAENRHLEFTMVDMDIDEATRTKGLSGGFLVGISDNGAVLQATLGQSRDDARFGFIDLQWVDPFIGRLEPRMKVTPGGEFELPGRRPLLQPGSPTVVVPLFQDRSSGDPYFAPGPTIALVAIDLADGHLVSRLDLSGDDRWSPLGIAPSGVLLASEREGTVEVSLIDIRTGQRTDVARLPAGSQVTVRGGTGH